MDVNFPKLEEKILKFWKDKRIFEKSVERRPKAGEFVFYEGPPTANGRPGIHHVLARVFKDIICRYKTMRGFRVQRKAGWDTHGLPVELEIEKKLGLHSKSEIEKFGVEKFNKECRKSVWKYKEEWEKLTERIGFWLDMANPYVTYAREYIEAVWGILKKIWRKNLLYQDFKVVPYCPRCGTSLSSHEVALGYKSIQEPSIYVKFPIKNPKFQNVSLLVWTTTPWTLPGNVAVAFNPAFSYVKAKAGEEFLILAKERVNILGDNYEIVEEIPGKDLLELTYQPPFDFYRPDYRKEKIWETVPADFVSLEEGTGLVHIAPAFGEEDMGLIKMTNSNPPAGGPKFPVLMTVDEQGKFNLDIKNWAGLFVKDADPLIINDLKHRGVLFKEELCRHDYPFCWRCRSPLLYYAKKSWFIRMTAVKQELIKNNQKINWLPSHLKEGRFGEWLRKVKDWALSRERYWGTPLPVWQCSACQNSQVTGSLEDLLAQKFSQNHYFILRHGESLTNKKKLTSCWPEKVYSPLTKKGEKQIKLAARKLAKEKIDLIFSSDLLRTKQTSQIVGEALGIKPKFDKRLREVDVGSFNGKPINEAGKFWATKNKLSSLEYYSRRWQIAAPGGENYRDIERRMWSFIKEIDKKYQGKNILIISHGRPLALLEKILLGQDSAWVIQNIIREKEIKTGELRKLEFKFLPYDDQMELNFHRPYIDQVQFFCSKCQGGLMARVPEVIDCWFDSGSMPFASTKLFPADYVCEAIDQTRGWFYTLLAIATLLGFGPPFKNVISLGHILDEKGEKMSKSRGNVVDPWQIIGKYGVDANRWYFYTINRPGEPKLFSEKDIDQTFKKFILIFWNCFAFYKTYSLGTRNHKLKTKNLLDKWVISKLNGLILETAKFLDAYDVTGAARAIERFTVEDLSLWYIRRSRKRFNEAAPVLKFVLLTLSKLLAPFTPFLAETIYQEFAVKESVHLDDWPIASRKSIDKKLEEAMVRVREIVSQALAQRAKAGIKVRQPLGKLQITNNKLQKELLDLIKEEVNVKEIVFGKSMKLDIELTPELREEGIVREIIRHIQEIRREMGFRPQDKIVVNYTGSENLGKILDRNRSLILGEARAKDLVRRTGGKKQARIGEENIFFGIKKFS